MVSFALKTLYEKKRTSNSIAMTKAVTVIDFYWNKYYVSIICIPFQYIVKATEKKKNKMKYIWGSLFWVVVALFEATHKFL